jgi:hypothetical protein
MAIRNPGDFEMSLVEIGISAAGWSGQGVLNAASKPGNRSGGAHLVALQE